MTLNGQDIENDVPTVNDLYTPLNTVVNVITGKEFAPQANKSIGLSINVIPPGGQFCFHHDRTEITAILYLNEIDGGEMELYPRYRIRLKQSQVGIKKWLQLLFDLCVRQKPLRALFGRQEMVIPKPGKILIMEASKCLHRVCPVVGNRERYSAQLAYDLPGTVFTKELTKDYYGYQ